MFFRGAWGVEPELPPFLVFADGLWGNRKNLTVGL